ncbi:Calcium-binding protein [Actinidia chinensis var. chinensis]|uniref:Calcium-binding protein n=1 Tax=Actinidia chinensis var. chinensis TaxID=1590841 RepID=A0A2R6PFB9_ACTCC|nr:Calcium-binding protein [Actinidia chinensis var. chinensis]
MAYHSSSHTGYTPSAPPAPDSHGSGRMYPPPTNYYGPARYGSSHGYPDFPPGTHPDVIRSFQMVDMDRSGFIDESELQRALSSGYQRFSLRTIRLLVFLFKNPNDSLKLGPKEFAALWSCLGQWRAIFERFDRDRSGKIDSTELRDALYSLGYAIPPSVLQVLISRYDDGSGRSVELNFDSFVECGMIMKGLTEKFKEKDPRYSGTATLTYDTFMSMIIPFLVS